MAKTITKQELVEEKARRLSSARVKAGYGKRTEAIERFRWPKDTYASHEQGRREFDREAAERYAEAYGTTIDYLLAFDKLSEGSASATVKPAPNASFPPRWQNFPGETSIPLRGQISAGANGRFIMNGQDIAQVFCPPGLEGVEGAYAVQIQGTSGEPRFYNGETAWVNPHLRVRKGDDVVVQILGDFDDDEVSSYIKRFVSTSNGILRLYQYNPGPGETHDLEFPEDKVFSVHKVVFHAML